MRFFYRARSTECLDKELSTVLEVLFSNIFIYLDLIVFSSFLAYLLHPLHGSIAASIGIFAGFNLLFLIFYAFLEKRFKDRDGFL